MLQRTPDTLLAFDPDAVEIGKLYRQSNEADRQVKQLLVASVRDRQECGRRLIAKKDQVGHGHWLEWLQANADVLGFKTRRTAAMLMKEASKWEASFSFDDLTPAQALEISRQTWGHNPISNGWVNSGDDEWFTQPKYIELARTVLGAIDCDPASCAAANRTVKATKYFSKADNGLAHKWRGHIWLNPPYSKALVGKFVDKLITEYSAGRVTAGDHADQRLHIDKVVSTSRTCG